MDDDPIDHPGETPERGDPHPEPATPVLAVDSDPTATSRARRWAVEQLLHAGLDELSADAELVVGELVGNALLHVGPPVEVTLRIAAPRLRIEVADPSPVSPLPAGHDPDSMTGRGLRLVDGIARTWGVERASAGKLVWAELAVGSRQAAGPSHADATELLSRWAPEDPGSLDEATSGRGGGEQRYTVRLGDVPTDLLLSAKAHVDDLVREFTLAAAGERTGETAEVPRHLRELLEAVVERFAEPRREIKRQALAAARADEDHVTLELTLPASAADAGEEYLRALDDVDAYCRAARLLTVETPPRQRVFRHWYVEELVAHLRWSAAGAPSAPAQTFEQRLLSEVDAMADGERRAERSARLHDLAAALGGALSPEEVADRALNEGVSAMGASGGGLLLATDASRVPDPSRLEVSGTIGYDERLVAGLRAESPDADLPAARAARTGRPVWLESKEERDAQFPALVGLEPGAVSMCALPLIAGDQILGALRFSFSRARLFDDDERTFALNLATQTAQALDRALLYHQQAETARRLQRSLLPPELPDVPGVDLASRYDSAEAADLGGDFYDVVGAGAEWTLVVGDVRGKGVEASRLSAMARHTVRGGALSGLGPAEILGLLNRAFRSEASPESFCTAVCGRLRLGEAAASLTVASGGHPQPVVVRANGAVELVPTDGILVGAFVDTRYETATTELHPGDLVLFYTDGVTRARRDGRFFGDDRLAQQLTAAAGRTCEAVLADLHAAVESFQTGQRDDIAMLAMRLLPARVGDGEPSSP